MKKMVIRENSGKTEVIIDGIKFDNLCHLEIKKEPDRPLYINLSGTMVKEVQIET